MRFLLVLRGLILGLSLSAANLLGAFLTVLLLGGLGDWTGTQFIGLFALLELGTGVAFIVGPNIWSLPVVEWRERELGGARLDLGRLTTPHWAGGVKSIAGGLLLVWVLTRTELALQSLTLVAEWLLIAVACAAISLMVARWGVARPSLDVVQLVVRRPGRPERALPGLSLSAAVLEFVFNLGPFPLVKVLAPTVLYHPALWPSPGLLGGTFGLAAGATILSLAAWKGRFQRGSRDTQNPDAVPAGPSVQTGVGAAGKRRA